MQAEVQNHGQARRSGQTQKHPDKVVEGILITLRKQLAKNTSSLLTPSRLRLAATIQAIKEAQSKSRANLIAEICLMLHRMNKIGCEVGFMWRPAHVGMRK